MLERSGVHGKHGGALRLPLGEKAQGWRRKTADEERKKMKERIDFIRIFGTQKNDARAPNLFTID